MVHCVQNRGQADGSVRCPVLFTVHDHEQFQAVSEVRLQVDLHDCNMHQL